MERGYALGFDWTLDRVSVGALGARPPRSTCGSVSARPVWRPEGNPKRSFQPAGTPVDLVDHFVPKSRRVHARRPSFRQAKSEHQEGQLARQRINL